MKHDLESIAKIRKTHLGRFLYELNRAYKSSTMAFIHSHGFPELTAGYLGLLSQVDLLNPTSLQELIKRIGQSKQGVSRTLATCEKLGYIRRYNAESDNRSTLVEFTPKGIKLMKTAAQAIVEAERTFSESLGTARFLKLKSILEDVSKVFDLVKIDL